MVRSRSARVETSYEKPARPVDGRPYVRSSREERVSELGEMRGADDAGTLAELAHEQGHFGQGRGERVLAQRTADVRLEQVERGGDAARKYDRVQIEQVLNVREALAERFAHLLEDAQARLLTAARGER